jgi:hypothetical protein
MIYNAPMANKANYTFRFDPDLIERIDAQGRAENRSRTNMLEVMAMDYLRDHEPKPVFSSAGIDELNQSKLQ